MKRKVLMLSLALALVAILALSATLAYFTDTDYEHNTMVIGNVKIDQFEKQFVYDENGAITGMEDYVNPTDGMMPAAGKTAYADDRVDFSSIANVGEYAGETFNGKSNLWAADMNPEDKVVFVKNTGNNDVYFRTIILVEYPEEIDAFGLICGSAYDYNYAKDGIQTADNAYYFNNVVVDGINYYAFVATYYGNDEIKGVLAPDTISEASLVQLAMYNKTTQEEATKFGAELDVLCFTQAVQTKGFADADSALNTAFGELTFDNIQDWANEMFAA